MAADKVVYESVSVKENKTEIPVLPIQRLPHGWGTRHTQAVLLFISMSVLFTMRTHVSVSLVAMTSDSTLQMWYPNVSNSCLHWMTDGKYEGEFNDSKVEDCSSISDIFGGWNVYRVYDWDKPVQEMIQFSFFVGYTCGMMPMGMLAHKYGGKKTIMAALGINGVLSIITPWLPLFASLYGICTVRFIQGVFQSCLYPSVHTMLGKWAPVSERGRLSSCIYTGSQFGTVVAFQIAGYFAGNPTLGWPSTFWFFGALSLISFVLLGWLGAATPYEHPNISSEEFVFIVGGSSSDLRPKERRTPWKYILNSTAIWGIVAAQIGSSVGYIFILTQIPIYMSKILNVDIKNNGLLSSLPYISMYLMSLVCGFLADMLVKRKILRIVNVRRLSNTLGLVVSSIFLAAFCYVQSTTVAVILLVLCLATHSGICTGYHINAIDLAPNFAGPIMAFCNMLSNLSSLTIPFMVSSIIGNDTKNQDKWQVLFLAVAALQMVANTVFVIFARGSVQPWNHVGSVYRYDIEMRKNNKYRGRKTRSLA
ncbi:hypothetical protein O0L34_g5770 [Tuta absoluta]|nr:hypothetical protein O0L34_g5770 [Tuta absoluta]